MQSVSTYDVAIVGGGLAGLASSILLARAGHTVVLFEKESYPFHKVCGEYISTESWNFLLSLGVPLKEWNLPLIDTLTLTAPNGKECTSRLSLGGFGVSRFKLDAEMASIARQSGVQVMENTKVEAIERGDVFSILFNQQVITARLCLASYGKRSNLDVKWKRQFLQKEDKRLNNYVGVKYHIRTDWPAHMIGLHNFQHGYCGISKIEEDRYCLCYLTRAENLKNNGNNLIAMQEKVLYQNPHLKTIFDNADFIPGFPKTISQISFAEKTRTENGVLMLGDGAGMITPLCGNGMSIALHTAKLAALLGDQFLQAELSLTDLEKTYSREWQQIFAVRLRTGRWLQAFFGSNELSHLFVGLFRLAPFLARPLIRQTHGKPF